MTAFLCLCLVSVFLWMLFNFARCLSLIEKYSDAICLMMFALCDECCECVWLSRSLKMSGCLSLMWLSVLMFNFLKISIFEGNINLCKPSLCLHKQHFFLFAKTIVAEIKHMILKDKEV